LTDFVRCYRHYRSVAAPMILTAAATAMLDEMDRISCHLWDSIEREQVRGDSGPWSCMTARNGLPMNGESASRDLEAEVTVVHEQGDVEHKGLLLVLASVDVREINPFGRHYRRAVEV